MFLRLVLFYIFNVMEDYIMYLKFNKSSSYLCDYYNNKITSTLNFTIKEIEDFSELLNI